MHVFQTLLELYMFRPFMYAVKLYTEAIYYSDYIIYLLYCDAILNVNHSLLRSTDCKIEIIIIGHD